MRFLAPFFLLGALAVALPVIFHLVRKTTRERTVFSSLMFLRPVPPRLTRRNRLEHILLLLLRCAVLCLLALGFSRPFIKHVMPENPSAEPAKRIVVLVDTSASMRRANLWSDARDKVEAVLRKISPADHVALFTFDRQLTPLVTFEQWNSTAPQDRVPLAQSRLAETTPGWSATQLDQSLIRAAELLADTDDGHAAGPGQIILISDMQEGSRLAALQGQEWPKGIEVISERVAPRATGNAGIQLMADAGDTQRSTTATGVRIRVNNVPDSKQEQFRIGWARADGGFVGKPTEVYVPAGQSRVVKLPVPEAGASSDRVVLKGDEEDFDNTVFVVPAETARLNVLYIGSDLETDSRQPLYFVRRAFQETARESVRVVAKQPSALISATDVDAATLYVVTDALPETLAHSLRDQVAQGKTLLFAPTTAAAASSLGSLLGLGRLAAEEASSGNYAMLGEIDFRHPLFAPFADARYSDFTKIHFWKHRRLDTSAISDARVPARFDNGDAAIVDIPVGKGRVIVFTSSWHPADSQLALSSKFVPLLYSALELSGGSLSAVAQYSVGYTVPLPADLARAGSAAVIRPDGSSLTLAAGETNFTQTFMPGIYRVNNGANPKCFAVNLDATESRTAPLPLDELERLGAPVHAQIADAAREVQRKVRFENTELESRQKLWRWFILGTLAVLLIETLLAGWTARRRMLQGEATT